MASYQLIAYYRTELGSQLPAAAVDELTDGLAETWQHHRDRGLTEQQTRQATIAEFGSPQQILAAFVAHAPGRRTARRLLATGPVVGLMWGASLVSAEVWTWPVPVPAAAAFVTVLLAVVAGLLAAATTRRYQRTRIGNAAALTLTGLDLVMLGAVAMLAPAFVWPMAIAIPAGLVRVGAVLRVLPAAPDAGKPDAPRQPGSGRRAA